MTIEVYLSKKDLKARGWTDRLIRIFLGGPDMTVPNPYHKDSYGKHLYLETRVTKAEAEPSYVEERSRSVACGTRIRSQVERKQVSLHEIVETIVMPPMTISLDALLAKVEASKETEMWISMRQKSQVALDILLDTMKSLEWHLDPFMWHPGIRHARKLLRGRMLAHIIDHYPALAAAARERGEQDNGDPGGW